MPVANIIHRGQSEAGFFINLGSPSVHVETGLGGSTQAGVDAFKTQLELRLPGWTVNSRGNTFVDGTTVNPVRWGGTSFVSQWIDPRLGPGDDTPISSNTDVRLDANRGQVYFNSLDALITAHNATTDFWASEVFRQTFEIDDSDASSPWAFDDVQFCRAVALFIDYEASKFTAAGKPFIIGAVQPGTTSHGNSASFRSNFARQRRIYQHLAANGRRDPNPALAGYAVRPFFRILASASDQLASDHAQQADNVTRTGDFLHQSALSYRRTGKQMALSFARAIAPATPQEFDGPPTIDRVVRITGQPNRIAVVVKITTGNTLRWQGPAPEDTDLLVNCGTAAEPALAHWMVHTTQITTGALPTPLAMTSCAAVQGSVPGYARMEITLASPVPATCYFTLTPARTTIGFVTRRAEAIAPSLKLKTGLYEVSNDALVMNQAASDVLDTPNDPAMFVLSSSNLLVGAAETFSETPMPFQLSVPARNAVLDAIEPFFAGKTLEIRTGAAPANCAAASTGTVLATITLPADPMAAAASGSKALSGTWSDASAEAAGTAAHFRVMDGATCNAQGSITATGGGGDITLDDVTPEVGQTVTITAFNLTAPNA